ncbi:MAG: glycoside hydrolase 43 family protein [Saprospiraceae bacterium]
MIRKLHLLPWLLIQLSLFAQTEESRFTNPIIHADYSDPDVIRVGSEFYLTASSFNCAPGLPILHSRDLVHWKIVNYVFQRQFPEQVFAKPQHGSGVWAPAIRFHHGWFYIFYGDPDFGIYRTRSRDPEGDWERPHLVVEAKGWIDPCPFWDDDGRAYLVHALAGSRAGSKSIILLHKMTPDGDHLLDDGVLVFDGHDQHPTIEGTKMHKRNGYYYILAPAGGVANGWQTMLRSKNIYGPYEAKIILHQGETEVNGPHQGAWVELENGEDWFIHFQEKQPYGRVVHLQPARWVNNWLQVGQDSNQDGIGEPVASWTIPSLDQRFKDWQPQTTDEFNEPVIGLQWQWQANPQALWALPGALGYLRLNPALRPDTINRWSAPYLLLQKMPAESFTVRTKVNFHHHFDGERTGLIVMGIDYAHLSLIQENDQLQLQMTTCTKAQTGHPEQIQSQIPARSGVVELQVTVSSGGMCRFGYRYDSSSWQEIGPPFQAKEGKWIGAKIGIFCDRLAPENDGGYADYDWFRVSTN